MQLTQLEIKGFKSFGDKTNIHFDRGITSIVGPNGCGKSNVVDAIRWVLGEQSTKALRSEKMENIIFNGTNTRKAAQLAEVSLSFNNTKNILPTDYSQVTITRKLYRNGDSEYRLNDIPCRLKDITDLFLDTGIGSDSYAIIELSKVEEIISNKDHSRRNLFEEAAGISKYKIRKKQTFSKLNDTENDLSRVEDILYEIEKNLRALENQAKKAERYYKLKEQYKTLTLELTALKTEKIIESSSRVTQQKQEEELTSLSISSKIAELEANLQASKNEALLKEQNLSVQQKKLNEQLSSIRAFETENKIKNEQLSNFKKREEQLAKSIRSDKQQVNHVHYQLKRLREEALEATQHLKENEIELADQNKELALISQKQQLKKEKTDALTVKRNELQFKIHDIEKQLAVIEIQKEALKQEISRNAWDEENKENELSIFNEKLAELSRKSKVFEETLLHAQKKEEELQATVFEKEKTIEEVKEKSQQLSRSLDAKQNEYNLTKSLVDNLEGYPESIRFLRKNTEWGKAIPLFSDILLCQEEYKVAIENLLEPFMNYYVVDSFQEALTAVHLLNDSGKGKAGFFVLESLPKIENDTIALKNLIPALSVIEVDEKYRLLSQHLLQNVYIQKNSTAGAEMQDIPHQELTLLNPEGRYIKKRFSITGGSVGLFEGKRIGRSKNLEKLAKEIKSLKKEQEDLSFKKSTTITILDELKNQSQKAHMEELKTKLTNIQNEFIAIKSKHEQYESFLRENTERKEGIDKKIISLEKESQATSPLLLRFQKELAQLQTQVSSTQEEYSLLSDERTNKSALYNKTNLRYHQQKNKITGIEKDLEYREIQIDALEKQLSQQEEELQGIQDSIKKNLLHVGQSEESLLRLYEQKENLEKGLQEFEQLYYSFRSSLNAQEEEINKLRKRKENSDQLLHELKDKINAFNLELNAFKERLSVEFSFDLNELPKASSIEDDEYTLEERTQKIKKQLQDFGAVNPMAMDAFKEMKDRYLFIQKEKEDLIEAKNTLLKTIKEIDQNAKERFMDSFNQIRENFIKVFRSLFNEEDTCDLIITDPDHPLASDIEIIARPKGKKPLSINQLSGGEKTLTSTALLFSLYLLKPAPFCIFDEIDAPLDDTNIDKFNNIIREFSDNSQFIIVSHNKRTIASTDIIYGVTMAEPGVSRVVAVDMRESLESIINVEQAR